MNQTAAQNQQQIPVAIVTGGARRVGRAIALSLVRRGLAIVVHHSGSDLEAEQVVREIVRAGGMSLAVSADLRDPRPAAVRIFEAARQLGPVSVLINSAAVSQDRALPWIDNYHCKLHLAVNLLAPVFLIQELVRHLPADFTGRVINLLDWRADRPGADHLIYTASKAALASVTRSLAQQLAPRVLVNGVAPGEILRPDDPSHLQQRTVDSIPLRRTGSPRDLCDAIHFLLDATFITGEILHVSGGEEL